MATEVKLEFVLERFGDSPEHCNFMSKVNQSNIFLYYVMEKLIFLKIHNILENPQILQREF